MAEANQSIFSNRHIMVTQDATDLEVIQNGDNTEEVANCSIRCETKYDSFSKVCFKISWNKGCIEWNTYSTKTSSAAVNSFLQVFYNSTDQQIVYVHNIKLEYNGNQVFIKFNPTTNQARLDAVVCACDKALLGCDGYRNLAAVVPNIYHEYLVAERRNEINEIINSQIHIKTFNTNNESSEQYTEDDFDKINTLLGCDGYRNLAAVVPNIYHEYLVAERRNEINEIINSQIHIKTFNTNNESCEQYTNEDDFDKINSNIWVEDVEVGNGIFCSISTLLKVLIPFWKSGEKPVIYCR
ncbi:2555_t:CDS:2 [Entrophospora sp. SA101]|nr:2555_t:CDS:2 [Entrophospora sp. SA101]